MQYEELQKAYNELKKSFDRLQAENTYLRQQMSIFTQQHKEYEFELPDAKRREQFESNLKSAILGAIPDHLFILNEQGTYIEHHGNTQIAYLNGDIIGKNIREIDLPPTVVESMWTYHELALTTSLPQWLQYQVNTPCGKRYYEARIIKCSAHLVMQLIRDVTAQRLAEEKIKTAEHYKRTILRMIPDMILVINNEGVIIDIRGKHKSYPLWGMNIGTQLSSSNLPEDVKKLWLQDNIAAKETKEIQFSECKLNIYHETYYYETHTIRYRKDSVLKVVRDISSRKKAEEQLKAEANRRHAILRAIPDILFLMNDKGEYLDYKGGRGQVIVNPNQVIGTNIREAEMPATLIAQILEVNQKALDTTTTQFLEYELVIEGRKRYYESRTVAYAPQQVLRIVRDITEQKEVEQQNLQLIVALQIVNEDLATNSEEMRQTLDNTIELTQTIAKRELYYKTLLEVSPDIVFCVNKNRNIEFLHIPDTHVYNDTMEIEDFLGHDFIGKIPEESLKGKALESFEYVLNTGRRTSYEMVSQHPILGQRYYHAYFAPIVASGEVISIYILVKDITNSKEAEDRLKNINKDLIRQNNQLAHYSYVVSHNLRSPIASILGLINLLNMTVDEDEKPSLVQMLAQCTQKLDSVVMDLNNILSATQIVEENKEDVYFEVVTKNITQQLSPQITNCEAEVSYDFLLCPKIHASKHFIHNVLMSVITNSLKFRRPHIKTYIQLNTFPHEQYICLQIMDNGMGIDLQQQQEHLFKLYKRFHPHIEGKGIGLYILKTQVEIQGGKVEIESQPNKGTTLRIYFLRDTDYELLSGKNLTSITV